MQVSIYHQDSKFFYLLSSSSTVHVVNLSPGKRENYCEVHILPFPLLSGRLLSSTGKVNITSICFRTLSQSLFILMKKYRWKSKLPLGSSQPDPRAQLFSTATSQLPCKPAQFGCSAFCLANSPSGSAITKLSRSLCTHTSTIYQRLNKFCPRRFWD